MIHYLLENGASLSLETKDGETPLKIGVEEYELSQEAGSVAQTVAEECLKYLIGVCVCVHCVVLWVILKNFTGSDEPLSLTVYIRYTSTSTYIYTIMH